MVPNRAKHHICGYFLLKNSCSNQQAILVQQVKHPQNARSNDSFKFLHNEKGKQIKLMVFPKKFFRANRPFWAQKWYMVITMVPLQKLYLNILQSKRPKRTLKLHQWFFRKNSRLEQLANFGIFFNCAPPKRSRNTSKLY